jgi:uncharacterized phiE125 gp8 family phage protein
MIVYSRVTTAPAEEPVTLEEAKLFLRVDGSDEDALITSLITVARQVCEAYAGLSFITQTRSVKLDRFSGDLALPYGPVDPDSIEVEYIDSDDADQTLDPASYYIDVQSGLAKLRVNSDGWPGTNRTLNNVVVTYDAGYENAAAVPEVIKLAIKKRIAFDYEKRGDESEYSHQWQDLLDTVKVYWNAEVC